MVERGGIYVCIYVYMCVCVCMCMCRKIRNLIKEQKVKSAMKVDSRRRRSLTVSDDDNGILQKVPFSRVSSRHGRNPFKLATFSLPCDTPR